MPDIITVTFFRTRVVNGIVQGPSEVVTVSIVDNNRANGLIDAREWTAAIGGVFGHNAGDNSPGALWKGDRTGNLSAGSLYSPVEYFGGENVQAVLDGMRQNFPAIDPTVLNICFRASTPILTPQGERAVETLRPGDLVMTRDAGAQPLLWVGAQHLTRAQVEDAPHRRPIRIGRGALGQGLPVRPVTVSPQHRVLVRTPAGEEVLVPARHLAEAGVRGIRVERTAQDVHYVHLALAGHHVLTAAGAAMESLFVGPMALGSVSAAARAELTALFPPRADGSPAMTPARRFLTRREALAQFGGANLRHRHLTPA